MTSTDATDTGVLPLPAIRTLLRTTGNTTLRVIDRLNSGITVTIDVHGKRAQPQLWTAHEVQSKLNQSIWTVILVPKSKTNSTPNESHYGEILIETRWKCAQQLLRNPDLYHRETRQSAIEEAARELKVSTTYLRNVMRIAWQGGMTRDSLRTNLSNCGRHDGSGKRGRPPTITNYKIYSWDAKQREKIRKFVEKEYLKNAMVTQKTVWDLVRGKFYCCGANSDGTKIIRQLGDCPTKRQIRSIIEQIPDIKKLRKAHGRAGYQNNFKPTIGCIFDDVTGPGHTYEIDATQIDNWIISSERGKVRQVIGKATLYLIACRFSRLIVGWHLSLDPPSWTGALLAILSIFQDKEQMCRLYKTKYEPSDWPGHGLMPERFFADRGSELTGHNSDLLVSRGFDAKLTNARALWSAAKSVVENSFKLLHVHLKEMNAGYDPSYNTKKRRPDKNFRSARYTIAGLRRNVFKIIIRHNTNEHLGYRKNRDDVRQGIKPIPALIYYRGLSTYGRPSAFAEQEVLFQLLPEDTGSVDRGGINFIHARYSCPEALKNGWYTRRAARKGDFSVRARHNPGVVDTIYVIDPDDPSRYYLASLVTEDQDFAGMTRAELINLAKLERAQTQAGTWRNSDRRIASNDENAAEQAAEPMPPAVKTEKGPALRAVEQRSDRTATRRLPDPNGEAASPPVEPTLPASDAVSVPEPAVDFAGSAVESDQEAPDRAAALRNRISARLREARQ